MNIHTGMTDLEMEEWRRDASIDQAEESSGDEWQEEATRVLKSYLEEHDTMRADDLWDYGLPWTKCKQGLGAVIKKATTNGWISPIEYENGYVAAYRSEHHHRSLKQVWQSNLYNTVNVDLWSELF